MKLNKKGFTLIELLAVIAILAILVVIAVPNILNLFNESRTKALAVDAQAVYEAAQTQWQLGQFNAAATENTTYTNISGESGSALTNASISGNASYCVTIDKDGKVTKFSYSQGNFSANPTGSDIKKTDIEKDNTFTAASCS